MQNKGAFPSDTHKNAKDCMAIQLRSGKEVSNSSRKETAVAEKKRRKRPMKKKKKLEEKKRRIC